MKSANKKRTPEEGWSALERLADEDRIAAILSMSEDELDQELRAAGFDPEEEARRGVENAAKAPARIAKEKEGRAELAAARARVEARRAARGKLDLEDLKKRIELAKRHPNLPAQAAVAFRNRKEGEPGEAELEAMLDELEELIERHGGKADD
jgi:hypothetical protein